MEGNEANLRPMDGRGEDYALQDGPGRNAESARVSTGEGDARQSPGVCVGHDGQGHRGPILHESQSGQRHLLSQNVASRRLTLPSNLWMGTSVENQAAADERIPHLRYVPAVVRFLSVEPLLGPVDDLPLAGIDWVIVGGESGPKARPCDVSWIRSIRDQCKAAGVPCFVKQLGAHVRDLGAMAAHSFEPEECWPAGTKQDGTTILLADKKGGDWSEWPEDLRVREFPQPVAAT